MDTDSAEQATEQAAPVVTETKLEIELLKNEDRHVCVSVTKVAGGMQLGILARPSILAGITAIHGLSGHTRHALFHRSIPGERADGLVQYIVLVPNALLKDALSFEVLNKRGEISPAFTAGRRKIKLPPKWQFSPYHLNLAYNPEGKGKSRPDQQARGFVRLITMTDESLTVDASIFIIGTAEEGPKEASVVVTRDGQPGVIYESAFPLTTAKKVFRVPVAMHKAYTVTDAVHGQIELPILSVFDDPAVYDLKIKIGEDLISIQPYNRYYFDKPSVHIVNGVMGSHVIRHFADPATGNIRISFQ